MQQTVFLISSSWLDLHLQQKTKRVRGGVVRHLQGKAAGNSFYAAVRRWKWEFQSTKVNFGVLRSESVKRSSLRASMRQLLTSELISKALWVGETACPGICGRRKKKKSHIALSLPLCLLSLPLRTDRSFDSGSKFTLQTCWEAGERSDGKAFLHFKDPDRLPDSLSKILRLIINLLFFFFFLHSCGCETSAEAPRVEERELQETNLYEATGWPNFFYGASDCSNSEGKKKSEIYHRCTRLQIQNASSVSDGVSFIKSAMELLMIPWHRWV